MAEFRIDPPTGATPTEVSDDLLAQLGPRAFSMRQEPDGLHIDGNITEAEATTVLSGFAARKAARQQQAAADAAASTSDRDALVAIQTQWQTYLDTPLASVTGAMTVTAVKNLIRVVRYVIRAQRLG
jgi:hypothetical protein